MKKTSAVSSIVSCLATVACGFLSSPQAAELNLHPTPLYLGGLADPNIVFTLDDSGSMQWEFMPDDLGSSCGSYLFPTPDNLYGASNYTEFVPNFGDNNVFNFYCRSSGNNKIFYDPDVSYKSWLNSDGDPFVNQPTDGDADPTAAFYNPADSTRGTLDLTAEQTENVFWYGFYTDGADPSDQFIICDSSDENYCYQSAHTYWPITYYNYSGTGNKASRASYTRVQITNDPDTDNGADANNQFTSPGGITRTRAEEIQNFANWFQYYRSRILTARAGVGRAFAGQGTNLRVGFGAINQGSTTLDGISSPGAMIRGVRRFSGSDRDDFFTELYGRSISGGTPLRRALDDVGQYIERIDNRGPWGNSPGNDDSTTHLSCRQNYNILMTDGYWNSDAASTPEAQENVDGNDGSSIDSSDGTSTYPNTATAPYQDDHSNTLADVAMYYWYRDLRPLLDNDIPTNSADPAFWQHLVNFTVGLGVTGTLDPTSDWEGLKAGTTSWPDPSSGSAGRKIDDLWHTAVNSRGDFFSAADPDTFADALSDTLANISDRDSSSAAATSDSGSISDDSKLFQASFDSGDWSGLIKAFDIQSDGSLDTSNPAWDTSADGSEFNNQTFTSRRIVTFNPKTTVKAGIPFRWPGDANTPTDSELDVSQIAALNDDPDNAGTADNLGEKRLNYLRGNPDSDFRSRTSKLGDIVHSAPVYVGKPNFRYPRDWDDLTTSTNENTSEDTASVNYATFKQNNATRTPLLYVGANDGMLHAFEADDGKESFAYIPNSVFDNLNELTSEDYTHKYFVDGSPTVVDALIGSAWKTALVGGLGGGGQGIYALDITDPPSDATTESTIASKVLWEFTDADDADLGYTYSEPNIVRMHDGKWYAVFGNGYNNTETDSSPSTTGNAVLYIINLETGATASNPLIRIDTGEGENDHPYYTDSDPDTDPTPNGLSTVTPIDFDGDYIVDYIYAGDLYGNLWKFDVTSATSSQWGVAYKDADSNPMPLFSAKETNAVHPITVRPQIGKHPFGLPSYYGVMVYFGTGKYIETGDDETTSAPTETIYAVWDREIWDTSNGTEPTFSTNNLPLKSHLLQQQITKEVTQGFDTDGNGQDDVSYTLRVTSDNDISWHGLTGVPSGSTHLGWYMDLVNTDGNNTDGKGEKLVFDPILRNGRLIFVTLVPSSNSCVGGGDGWVMALDAEDGGRLNFAPYDFNGDKEFNQEDYIDTGETVNGKPIIVTSGGVKFDEINTNPSISSKPKSDIEMQYFSDTDSNINTLTANKGPREEGRQSWRQVQ